MVKGLAVGEKKQVKKQKKKTSLFRWRGVAAGEKRIVRMVLVLVLAVTCGALTFTQLGFAGIGFSGQYDGYIVVLLMPVAFAALLLGTLWGFLMGLLAGAFLLTHAIIMPLDFYELTFVTPLSSVFMLGLSGLVMGLMFAFALRNDPSPLKRAIYIGIVCIVVSFLYSIGFLANGIIIMVTDILTSVGVDSVADMPDDEINTVVQAHAVTIASRMGSMDLQIWADAAGMSVLCIVADLVVRRLKKVDNVGLRPVFAEWLAVVVLVTFMVTSGMSFAAITQSSLASAEKAMQGEVTYLCTQLDNMESRNDTVINTLDSFGVGPESGKLTLDQMTELSEKLSIDSVLDGYDVESDGIVLVLFPDDEKYYIFKSDDSRFVEGGVIVEGGGDGLYEAIGTSLASGHLERFILDKIEIFKDAKTIEELVDEPVTAQISYVYAEESSGLVVAIAKPASMVFAARAEVMAETAFSVFVMLAAVFVMVFMLLSRLVVRRIDETNGVLGRITHGDLDAQVNVRDTREFASLSDGVNETVGALKDWIAEAETRMDAELSTAKAIQESALPRVFPPYPDIPKFDVYAIMNAAREVGGDFYDVFLIGDTDAQSGKLGFVMADVSGKGVPAALFMMKAKTLIRDYLESGMEVGEAVENANRLLSDGNDAGMFVTAWVGVLDYATGHIDYVNAGHNPPLLWSYKEVAPEDGAADAKTLWRWVNDISGMPLGLFDAFPYDSYSMDCLPGEMLLLYTDGVTEAMSVEGELYGEQRLIDLASAHPALHPRRLVEVVRRDVARHATGAEQSDDITILALEVGVPPEITATLIVPADVAELPHVNEFIHAELDRRLCPVRAQSQLDIAVEELFVNVAHYAYPDATPENPGLVRVSYTYSAEPPSIIVQIADKGIPYNPLEKPDAVTPDDVMDVPIGGLGILMAKNSVNDMKYEYANGHNVVTIEKKW